MGILSPNRLRVAVLRGGPSAEYDESLKTGGRVLSVLREMPDQYDPLDIFISKEGEWHEGGVAREPYKALRNCDVVWNALHGTYGNGEVHKDLEPLGIPFTGPGKMSSLVSLNKDFAKKTYESIGILTPRHVLLREELVTDNDLISIFQTFLHPVIVKPAQGDGVGVKLAHSFYELRDAIVEAFQYSKRVLVEEFVKGKTASVPIIEGWRGERLYALLPVEIAEAIVSPGVFTSKEKRELESLARAAHEALNMRHYSVSDFVITPKGKIYILETNANPKFYQESVLHQALEPVGMKPQEFVTHVINLALER